MNTPTLKEMIDAGRSLIDDMPNNPEFERGIVDLVLRLTDIDDENRFVVEAALGLPEKDRTALETRPTLNYPRYDRIVKVIDRVKSDDRHLDTDEYAGMIVDAVAGKVADPIANWARNASNAIFRDDKDALSHLLTEYREIVGEQDDNEDDETWQHVILIRDTAHVQDNDIYRSPEGHFLLWVNEGELISVSNGGEVMTFGVTVGRAGSEYSA